MAQIDAPLSSVLARETSDKFWSLLKNVRKHWAIVVATTMLSAGTGLVYSKSATKIYQAVTLIEIDPNPIRPLKGQEDDMLDMGAGNYWSTQEYYTTQYKLILSDRVVGKAAADLALVHDKGFISLPGGGEPTLAQATDALRRRVTVEPIKNSRLVSIKLDDADPARARRLCDAVAAAYIEQNLETAVNSSSDAVVWLGGQLDHVKQELEHDEDALHGFKQENDLPSTSINEASNMLRVEMQEFDTALTNTRTKKEELAAHYAELSKVSAENPDQLPASELLSSPTLQSLRKDYQEAEKEREALLAGGKGESHPEVKRATAKVSEVRTALLAEIKNIQGAVERDLAIVTREEKGEAALFEATRKRAVDLNMKEIEYHRLDRARDQNEKLYSLLLQRMKEADLARMMHSNNIRVVDAASKPEFPVRPRVLIILPLSSLVGILIGLGLALLRQQLDSSVKTPGDVEQILGVTFLGLLPAMDDDVQPYGRRRRRRAAAPTSAIELVVHDRPLSGIAEAARSVRTNLMFMNPDRPYKRLLISSAAPSEGKTTVACSIAIAFAQGGQRVCIVDCDLRRPRLHRIFGRAGEAGITSVLVGEAGIDDVIKPTSVPNLSSIPAGPLPPNPAELLHSARFKRVLEELSARFDRVIIDSPPVVAVTDSAIISTLVDGTVFVVRGFKTPRNLAAQGLRSLRDIGANVIGVVLNAVNLNSNEYDYYYHYYYYKREGYHSTASPGLPPHDGNQSASQPN